jgi:hypothetical protein
MRFAPPAKCFAVFCFAAYYTTLVYSELFHPRNFGIELHRKDGELIVSRALTNFLGARDGLRTGDGLVAVDGIRIEIFDDWRHFLAKRTSGQKYTF